MKQYLTELTRYNLWANERIASYILKAGETKTVTFRISEEDLKFYNSDLKFLAEPGDFKLFIGTNSRDVKESSFSFNK